MGFLSSLFGVKDRTPATTTNVVSTKLPEELSPFVKEVLGEAQDLYKSEIERGYDPYTGQTIAPLTAEEQQAMTGIAGLTGTTQPLIQEALETYRKGGDEFTAETAEKFMSPYQQAVTDIQLREAQRKFEGDTLPRLEAQAVGAGAMSGLGSRAGVEMAEAQRSQNQLLADIQARGSQAAFQDARQAFEAQQGRERQMAGDIGRTAPALFQAGLAEAGALQTVGQQKRELGQSALDEAYARFLEEKSFPQRTLADYSSTIYGNPVLGAPSRTTTTTGLPGAPSTGQQLLGLGLTGLNIYGAGTAGGTKDFNFGRAFAPRKEGGQVSGGLSTIYRANGGPMDDTDAASMLLEYGNINPDTGINEGQKIQLDDQPKISNRMLEEFFDLYSKMKTDIPKRSEDSKRIRSEFADNQRTMTEKIAKKQSKFSDESFDKRGKKLTERRERYPFASIQKGIAAGMKEPTIAMMITQGVAVSGDEIEKKASELDNMLDALEQQKFNAKSKEMSEQAKRNLENIKTDANLQLELLKLDEATQLKLLGLLKEGVSLQAALAKARDKSKVGKITQPYLNDRNPVIRSALKFQGNFQVVNGKAVFTGKNDKGQNLTGNDYRKIAEVEAKYDGYYNAAIRANRTPSEAAEYAKKLTLEETKGMNAPPPPPPPPGGKPNVAKPSQGASNLLATPVPTFGPN